MISKIFFEPEILAMKILDNEKEVLPNNMATSRIVSTTYAPNISRDDTLMDSPISALEGNRKETSKKETKPRREKSKAQLSSYSKLAQLSSSNNNENSTHESESDEAADENGNFSVLFIFLESNNQLSENDESLSEQSKQDSMSTVSVSKGNLLTKDLKELKQKYIYFFNLSLLLDL